MIASLVMGCANTKTINETLSEERAAANYLWMDRFPEQSQINRYLTRFSAENVVELGEVHAQLFMQQSQARRAAGQMVVDIDQSGLVANDQTYEFKRSRMVMSNILFCILTCLTPTSACPAVLSFTTSARPLKPSLPLHVRSTTSKICARVSSMPSMPSCASSFCPIT